MDSVTPKWAREAQEHLVKLSRRLDATEALCDQLTAALESIVELERNGGSATAMRMTAQGALDLAKGN